MNERLRDARRKLSVTSSREAARLVLAAESDGPEFLTDKRLGDASPAPGVESKDRRAQFGRWPWIIGGLLIVSLIAAVIALATLSPAASPVPTAATAPVDAATATETADIARAWLTLVDQGRWNDSWRASGRQFRTANTSEAWAAISRAVRPPLGAVASRTLLSQERIPAPPHGYLVVKFRTRFATDPTPSKLSASSAKGRSGRWSGIGSRDL